MHALNGEEMLVAWERLRERPGRVSAQESAVALLALALPERSIGELASLPLAERNALLLELRVGTLGRRMEGFATCPDCGAKLEFSLDARELATGLRAQAPETEDEWNGFTMRPVNTEDLLACAEAEDDELACRILLARTLEGQLPQDERLGLQSLSALAYAALLERFERLNSAAEIRVQMHCAACQGTPLLDLDIARYLVREIAGAARRLMAEIHELAGAYGWSERSIAAMSGARRAAYMEMLSA